MLLGGRELPPVMLRVIAYLAPALLSALVVTAAFADGQELHVGAETVGMLAGGVLLWRGKPWSWRSWWPWSSPPGCAPSLVEECRAR